MLRKQATFSRWTSLRGLLVLIGIAGLLVIALWAGPEACHGSRPGLDSPSRSPGSGPLLQGAASRQPEGEPAPQAPLAQPGLPVDPQTAQAVLSGELDKWLSDAPRQWKANKTWLQRARLALCHSENAGALVDWYAGASPPEDPRLDLVEAVLGQVALAEPVGSAVRRALAARAWHHLLAEVEILPRQMRVVSEWAVTDPSGVPEAARCAVQERAVRRAVRDVDRMLLATWAKLGGCGPELGFALRAAVREDLIPGKDLSATPRWWLHPYVQERLQVEPGLLDLADRDLLATSTNPGVVHLALLIELAQPSPAYERIFSILEVEPGARGSLKSVAPPAIVATLRRLGGAALPRLAKSLRVHTPVRSTLADVLETRLLDGPIEDLATMLEDGRVVWDHNAQRLRLVR